MVDAPHAAAIDEVVDELRTLPAVTRWLCWLGLALFVLGGGVGQRLGVVSGGSAGVVAALATGYLLVIAPIVVVISIFVPGTAGLVATGLVALVLVVAMTTTRRSLDEGLEAILGE